jgi:hypothetical protein
VQALLPHQQNPKAGKGKGKGKGRKRKGADDANGNDDKPRAPHTVYGAEHLLRLLVSTPRFLTTADAGAGAVGEEEVGDIHAYLQALLEHMAERPAALFGCHQEAPPDYALDVPRAHRP